MKNDLIYSVILSLLILSCAKTGTISGGPKDEDPPVLLKATPAMESINIAPEKITLDFDEFIDVKDLQKTLIVSPPLDKKPVTTLKGKSLVLEISDTLTENTTYSINFGNGLKDYNEGNPIPNFAYVFSTGDFIDSMAVTGQVVDAYTLEPFDIKENVVSVLLYSNLEDSAFQTTRALYVSNCDENGFFSIKNIREGQYHIFALTDINNSYIYDGDNELIAFIDSSFVLNASMFEDIQVDSTFFYTDSTLNDTSAIDSTFDTDLFYALHLNLYMFKEDIYKQKLLIKERKEEHKINLIFNEPQHKLNYHLLQDSTRTDWYIEEKNALSDTFAIWITDTTLVKNDSIWLLADYELGEKDSLYMMQDTILFRYTHRKARASATKKKASGSPKKNETSFTYSTKPNSGGKIQLNRPVITFTFDKPLLNFDTSKIHMTKKVDTLLYNVPLTFTRYDSLPRLLKINFNIEPELSYKMQLLPNAFTNVYHETITDTTDLSFRAEGEDYYGILNFNVTNVSENILIQMFEIKKNKIIRTHTFTADEIWRIEYLAPAEYSFRAIYDINNNGKWDEGSYEEKRQPEKVSYYNKTINIRSNWEIEEFWDLNVINLPQADEEEKKEVPK